MKGVFKSRKFYAAVIALGLVFFGERAGISGQQLTDAVYICISYILGTGLSAFRKS